MPFVHKGQAGAERQGIEEGPPLAATQLSPEGPEPQKIEEAVIPCMTDDFSKIEVDQVKLIHAQRREPGRQPFQYAKDIFRSAQFTG